MGKFNPRRAKPRDETGIRDRDLADANGPAMRDPRSVSAIRDFPYDRRGELLDTELDDASGDRGFGRSFVDDVRSDAYDDERRERR